MKVKIKLLSDALFGSGESIPGAEDVSIICDNQGFPMVKGTSIKGVLREEWQNYLSWTGSTHDISEYFGKPDEKEGMAYHTMDKSPVVVSDFVLSSVVRSSVIKEITSHEHGLDKTSPAYPYLISQEVLDAFTYLRTFTSIENGISKEGTLRTARCLREGLIFYGEIKSQQEALLKEVLPFVKWLGTMRTRGLGRVCITGMEEER